MDTQSALPHFKHLPFCRVEFRVMTLEEQLCALLRTQLQASCSCGLSLGLLIYAMAVELRQASAAVYARWESDGTIVLPRMLKPGKYHTFLSHNWKSAQDQARSIKQLLSALTPGLRVWLDVDDMRGKAGTSATNTANFEVAWPQAFAHAHPTPTIWPLLSGGACAPIS